MENQVVIRDHHGTGSGESFNYSLLPVPKSIRIDL